MFKYVSIMKMQILFVQWNLYTHFSTDITAEYQDVSMIIFHGLNIICIKQFDTSIVSSTLTANTTVSQPAKMKPVLTVR